MQKKKWTPTRKMELLSSRIIPIQLMYDVLKKHNKKLDAFITASAVGIYGSEASYGICTENSELGTDFLATICQKWENQANIIENLAIRTVKIRTGIVLGNGGFLVKMKPIFKNKLGSALGTGKQYMPWIDITDLCNIYLFAIQNSKLSGAYNAVISNNTTNQTFSELYALHFGYKMWLPNVPAFLLKLLLGEMSVIALEGKNISNQKILDQGFVFKYPQLSTAFQSLN